VAEMGFTDDCRGPESRGIATRYVAIRLSRQSVSAFPESE